jgi:hypothetical protein
LWFVNTLTLGSTPYSDSELLSILNQQPLGNGLIALARQLIAAKLNVAQGANDSVIAGTIESADFLIGQRVVPPIGEDFMPLSETSVLTSLLYSWNRGITLPPGVCPP